MSSRVLVGALVLLLIAVAATILFLVAVNNGGDSETAPTPGAVHPLR